MQSDLLKASGIVSIMGDMTDVTLQNFREILAQDGPLLLWFHSAWCSSCAAEARILAELEEEMMIAGVDADRETDINTLLNVRRLPAFFVLRNGRVTAYRSGFQTAAQLRDMMGKEK